MVPIDFFDTGLLQAFNLSKTNKPISEIRNKVKGNTTIFDCNYEKLISIIMLNLVC